MASYDQVHELLRARPFRPFYIRLTDALGYTITNPDSVAIGEPGMDLMVSQGHAWRFVDVPNILEIVMLDGRSAGPGSNGNGDERNQ